jgi:hypothetical protein
VNLKDIHFQILIHQQIPFFSNTINQNSYSPVQDVSWVNYAGLGDTTYNQDGDYDEYGNLKIVDNGPSNFESLLQSFLV